MTSETEPLHQRQPLRKMTAMGAALVAGTWPEEMEMLAPTINVLQYYKKLPSVTLLADAIEKHLWPCHRFNSCTNNGSWEARHETMDRDYHFREVALADEKAIVTWVQTAMLRGLDFNYPVWAVTFLTASSGRSALWWQFHHAIGDGLGLLFAASPMMDIEGGDVVAKIPLPSALLPKDRRKPEAASGSTSGGSGGFCCCCRSVSQFCKGLVFPVILKHDTELSINPPLQDRTPFLRFNGNRVYTPFPAVPLSQVKTIRERHVCSVNDVLMAALTGALRRYGAEVRKDPKLMDDGLSQIDFKSMVMMALPRPIDPNDLVGSMRNKMLFTSTPLPIAEPTAIGRLEQTIEAFGNLKSKPYMAGIIGVNDFAAGIAPTSVMRKIASEVFSKHSLLVTNVPNATQPLTMPKGGEQIVESHMVFPNIIPQVSIVTYNGEVHANIVADPALFPDAEKLGSMFAQEFDVLIKATSAE